MGNINQKMIADDAQTRGLILFITTITALSFGLTFGDYISNHPVYLLEGLRLSRENFLNNDWFLNDTAQYHQRFTWIVIVLDSIDFLEWGMAGLHAITIGWSLLIIAAILRLLDPNRYYAAWAVFLVIFVAVGQTKSLAASYLFTPALQPSGLAVLGYLGAIYYFMRQKYWWSGLCLAVAGLFHTNYLVLGVFVFRIFASSAWPAGRSSTRFGTVSIATLSVPR